MPATRTVRATPAPKATASRGGNSATSCECTSKLRATLCRTCTDFKSKSCPQCDFVSSRAGDLPRHALTHYKDLNFRCPWPECEFIAAQWNNLQVHLNCMHTFEAPYLCEFCKLYKTGDPALLSRHKTRCQKKSVRTCVNKKSKVKPYPSPSLSITPGIITDDGSSSSSGSSWGIRSPSAFGQDSRPPARSQEKVPSDFFLRAPYVKNSSTVQLEEAEASLFDLVVCEDDGVKGLEKKSKPRAASSPSPRISPSFADSAAAELNSDSEWLPHEHQSQQRVVETTQRECLFPDVLPCPPAEVVHDQYGVPTASVCVPDAPYPLPDNAYIPEAHGHLYAPLAGDFLTIMRNLPVASDPADGQAKTVPEHLFYSATLVATGQNYLLECPPEWLPDRFISTREVAQIGASLSLFEPAAPSPL